jgi:serine protease
VNKYAWLGGLLALASICANAATWTVGNATAMPGQTVQISLAFSGDGTTQAAEIDLAFDEARLTLPVSGGDIPGASVAGACVRSTSKTVTALVYSAGAPLPAATQVVCNLPFIVRASSRSGRLTLRASSKECATASGASMCVVAEGWIDVLGNPPPPPLAASAEETDTLIVLLSKDAPAVSELSNASTLKSEPLALPGLTEGVLRIRPGKSYTAAGDYLHRLQRQPDSPEAEAERYVYVDYQSREYRESAYRLLETDPLVTHVEVFKMFPWGSLDEPTAKKVAEPFALAKAGSAGSQDFLDVLGFTQAWSIAGGWGLVGVLDNGIAMNHPQLRSFTGAGSVGGSFVQGGNFLPYFSRNVGGRQQPFTNLDETQPSGTIYPVDEQCDPQDGADDGWLTYGPAGHGTHVSGLVAANGLDQAGVRGACTRCGIASVKRTTLYCSISSGQPKVSPYIHADIDADGLEHLYQIGAQVVNISFSNTQVPCYQDSNNRICKAISTAFKNDIVIVAAAGNNREVLRFPANDPRVASIGGLSESNAFWDESPGSFINCPYAGDTECGSNYAPDTVLKRRQEVVAPAKSVRSTFYPGITWSTQLGCGDEFGDGAANDGEGLCTGTSMSAPELSALYGLLRSINPVMRAGDPVNQTGIVVPDGVREVVTQTASRSVAGQPEDTKQGFGIPNAQAAAQKMLGTSRSMPVRNRVTPLFGMYSPGSKDYATVATPQLAQSFLAYATNLHRSVHIVGDTFIEGTVIPGYFAFPNADAGMPRARAMVLTTEVRPTPLNAAAPTPVPLVLLEKKRQGPVPCDMTSPACHGDTVVALESQVQSAVNAGYVYGGLQGYLYGKCSPEPSCIPPGAQALHVKCTAGAYVDCATFLEGDRLAFEAAGYTSVFLGAASSTIGYAYPVGDSDGDGLIDAMERVVGTSHTDMDSDDDGLTDATEYPLTMVPTGDPCAGPNITCTLGEHFLFANGFE